MTILASASFDSPATTDAALAALAAEAGLIDPEPSNKFEDNQDNFGSDSGVSLPNSQESAVESVGTVDTAVSDESQTLLVSSQETPMEEDMQTDKLGDVVNEDVDMKDVEPEQVTSSETSTVETFVGDKLGLKGGGRFRLGLLGGSPMNDKPILPNRIYKWRGLLGGGKVDTATTEPPTESTNTNTDNETVPTCTATPTSTSIVNTTESNTDVEKNISDKFSFDIKTELNEDEEEEEDFRLRLSSQSVDGLNMEEFNTSGEIIKEEFDDKIKNEVDELENKNNSEVNGNSNEQTEQKNDEPIGDALSTLASAALGRATPQVYTKVIKNVQFK